MAITQTGISAGQQAAAYSAFAVVGSLGVAVPLAIYLAAGDRAPETLARLKKWLGQRNNVITSALCLVIAAKLVSAVPALVGWPALVPPYGSLSSQRPRGRRERRTRVSSRCAKAVATRQRQSSAPGPLDEGRRFGTSRAIFVK